MLADQKDADPNCGEATGMPRFVSSWSLCTFAENLSNVRNPQG